MYLKLCKTYLFQSVSTIKFDSKVFTFCFHFNWQCLLSGKQQLNERRNSVVTTHHHHRSSVQRRRREFVSHCVDDNAFRLTGDVVVVKYRPSEEDELRQEDVEQRDGKGGILGWDNYPSDDTAKY